MVLSRVQIWTGILVACFSWLCVCDDTPRPVYMVSIPAVIQAGSKTRFCASLLQPNEVLVITISVIANGQNNTVLVERSGQEFHRCFPFQAPQVERDEVLILQVEVRGETFLSLQERKVMIRPYSPVTFIQTDKPTYVPGQTVNFRMVTLDTSLVPVTQRYDVVELEDVHQNRIGQWVNTTTNGNILQLSYPLNSEVAVGSYTITVWIGESKIQHFFKVAKYVLPRFEVKMNLSDKINIAQEEYEVEVCATYTYGRPVAGKAEVELCRPLITRNGNVPEGPDYAAPCHKESIEMTQTGCASYVFNMMSFKRAEEKMLTDSFMFRAKVEEEGTGVSQSKETHVALSYEIGTLSFIDTPQNYEHGSVIQGKINVVHFNNTPVAGMLVYLFEDKVWPYQLLQNLTTNSQGRATFSLSTASLPKDKINLRLSDDPQMAFPGYRVPHFIRGQHTISLIQSREVKTSSSLVLQNKEKPLGCGKEVSIPVRYTIQETVPKGSVDVVYLVLSRGAIVLHGHLVVTVQESPVTEGEILLKLTVLPDMAPTVQVLVYSVLPSETVIAHSANFPTEKCFRHKVSVAFSPHKAVPGEKNTLKVSALPGSLCGLCAVDQSVGIMEPGTRLDADKIFNLLPVKEVTDVPYELEEPQACLHVGPKRGLLFEEKNDPYQFFQRIGLKLATNLEVRIPSCLSYRGIEFHHYQGGFLPRPMMHLESLRLESPADTFVGSVLPPVQTVRSFFPETWLWDVVAVGKSGSADMSLTVPDTITSWDMDVFCLASGGFGLAPPVTLTVFQPFFLDLTLPYSIVRGERFELKATVFSYLSKCIVVSVTPTLSKDYTLTPVKNIEYSSCLCPVQRATFTWTMASSVLGILHVSVTAEAISSRVKCNDEVVSVPERGRMDTITRTLLVKAEGMEKTDTYNWLLCPTGGALMEQVMLELPKNVVVGSARASLSVLGDILGRALQNLGGLLAMPYGCGEQNMVLLAPNIHILEYLKNTEQLTPVIRDKATKFLTSGYQNELNYKHGDGAYSTFGQGSGNTWLTAFVLRSFGRAKSFIYIDPAIIEESRKWLGLQQAHHGCFTLLGKLFNNRMKGGVNDDVTLTAYVTAAMLEINVAVSDPVVLLGLFCLRSSTRDFSNTYTTALLAYTFTLAGDRKNRDPLLQHLKKTALQDGGLLHWSQTSSETSDSLAVEASAYVLLTILRSPTLSPADLGYASRIVRWLVRQQNAYGGFSSTQDTVVALQALALYATKVFSKGGASTVTVTAPSGGQHLIHINQSNKLLYQEKVLQETGGKYSVKVDGTACASIQVALHYNIPTPSKDTVLSIQVRTEVNCDSLSTRRRVTLSLQSGYYGAEQATNMIIVDVKMLSGFVPDPESLTRLRASLVDRVDTKDDHVLIYLTELQPERPLNHTLDVIQQHPVQNLKPAVVRIYDYYQPSDQGEIEYAFPCQ